MLIAVIPRTALLLYATSSLLYITSGVCGDVKNYHSRIYQGTKYYVNCREAIAIFLWSSLSNGNLKIGSKSMPLGMLDHRKGFNVCVCLCVSVAKKNKSLSELCGFEWNGREINDGSRSHRRQNPRPAIVNFECLMFNGLALSD